MSDMAKQLARKASSKALRSRAGSPAPGGCRSSEFPYPGMLFLQFVARRVEATIFGKEGFSQSKAAYMLLCLCRFWEHRAIGVVAQSTNSKR